MSGPVGARHVPLPVAPGCSPGAALSPAGCGPLSLWNRVSFCSNNIYVFGGSGLRVAWLGRVQDTTPRHNRRRR